MAGREKMKARACPRERAAQISAGEELLFPYFTGSKSKCSYCIVCLYSVQHNVIPVLITIKRSSHTGPSRKDETSAEQTTG